MEIETARLRIVALTPEQLEKLVLHTGEFEREYNCSYQGEAIEGGFKDILYGQSLKGKEDRSSYLWLTFWLLLRKADQVVVGMIDFKNIPDSQGAVEIGYGLGKRHEHSGYMTEAVQAFCAWGKRQKNVQYLTAETEKDNISSQRVLKRCGFAEWIQGETILWRL